MATNRLNVTWDPIEPAFGPPKPRFCLDGPETHDWMLSIEEGGPVLTSDCQLCTDGVPEEWDQANEIEMAPIPVRLTIEVERSVDDEWSWLSLEAWKP